MPTLSLVIPCYNEENTLRSIIERVLQLQSDSLQLELIIVDDCSKDKSWEVAQSLAKDIKELKIYRHEVNQGKGAALRTGFLQATGDFVGIQDADMEYNPQDYLIMLEPLLQNKADVVYGSRYLRPDTRRVLYYWHTWMNKTLTQCSNMFTNLDITDMETCYKLFRREVIQEIAPNLKENRFGFEPEVTAYVARNRYRVYECAIQYTPRTIEEGKKINWKDGVRALYCIFHYSASFAPLPMQLILYFLIGGFCALMNLLSFCLLYYLNVDFTIATISSFIIAAILNYFLCISILFRHKARWNSFSEIVIYLFTVSIMGCFDYFCTLGFCYFMTTTWSKAWSSFFGFVGNFVFRKFLVFSEHKCKR